MSDKDDKKAAPIAERIPAHLRPLFEGVVPERAAASVAHVLSAQVDRLSTGRVGRAMRLSRLAVSAGSKLALGKAKQVVSRAPAEGGGVSVDLAADMLRTFSEMRGLTMKVGQMLSYLDDTLPPEAQKVLALLQRDAPPMPYATVKEVLARELGEQLSAFASIDETPLAAASIGQVHRAVLKDGTAVAIKVQYPGIDEAMRADLKNARIIGLMKGMLFFRTDTTAILAELEERFLDECNYEKEAAYQEEYRQRFAGHPHIVVPAVHLTLTTRRVLTTTFHPGRSFYEWLAAAPSPEARALATRLFYRFYIGAFYMDGLFNCDPHPGNYLFQDDGKVVFLDYGCSRRFPKERLGLWIELCQAVSQDDATRMHELALAIGFVAEGVDYDRAAFRSLMRYLYVPYLTEGPYHFGSYGPQDTFRQMFLDNPNLFKLNMPADAVFLNRIGFGLVSLLTKIGSSLDCRHYAGQYFLGLDPDWPEDPFRARGPLTPR